MTHGKRISCLTKILRINRKIRPRPGASLPAISKLFSVCFGACQRRLCCLRVIAYAGGISTRKWLLIEEMYPVLASRNSLRVFFLVVRRKESLCCISVCAYRFGKTWIFCLFCLADAFCLPAMKQQSELFKFVFCQRSTDSKRIIEVRIINGSTLKEKCWPWLCQDARKTRHKHKQELGRNTAGFWGWTLLWRELQKRKERRYNGRGDDEPKRRPNDCLPPQAVRDRYARHVHAAAVRPFIQTTRERAAQECLSLCVSARVRSSAEKARQTFNSA